jgi:hypothetical protein
MTDNHPDLRDFRGGNWDLRKTDRRKEQLTIEFPDRRKLDRRLADQDAGPADDGLLWVDASGLDD